MDQKVIAIIGPTATGKTDVALQIAKKLNGEIIACDSRQIYTGLDIGTGKFPGSEYPVEKRSGYWLVNGIPIWMYDIVYPQEQYSVYQFQKKSREVINQITQRKKLPIIVGGTGFYLKSILEDIPNFSLPVEKDIRESLQTLSLLQLQKKLQEIDLDSYAVLNNSDKSNPRRLIRRVEIAMQKELQKPTITINTKIRALKIGLCINRDALYKRIDERVDKRVKQGMIAEAEKLHAEGLSFERMRELGLEYRYLADLLDRKINREEFVSIVKTKIHQYAKRQMTWFRKDTEIIWFDITVKDFLSQLEECVINWYNRNELLHAKQN